MPLRTSTNSPAATARQKSQLKRIVLMLIGFIQRSDRVAPDAIEYECRNGNGSWGQPPFGKERQLGPAPIRQQLGGQPPFGGSWGTWGQPPFGGRWGKAVGASPFRPRGSWGQPTPFRRGRGARWQGRWGSWWQLGPAPFSAKAVVPGGGAVGAVWEIHLSLEAVAGQLGKGGAVGASPLTGRRRQLGPAPLRPRP